MLLSTPSTVPPPPSGLKHAKSMPGAFLPNPFPQSSYAATFLGRFATMYVTNRY